jgi:hypothetical protein
VQELRNNGAGSPEVERQERQHLCMRRLFMRGQPFFATRRGRAFRWHSFQLHASVAAITALLAFISCMWMLLAHEQCKVHQAGGEDVKERTLGQMSLAQFWDAPLPLQAMSLRGIQVATYCAFLAINTSRRCGSRPLATSHNSTHLLPVLPGLL